MTKIRNISIGLASLLIASGLTLVPSAALAADLELPVIDPSSVSVSAPTVAAGGQITGTFRVTDDVGCCDFNRIDMRNSAGDILLATTPSKVSGTPTDAIYSSQISVPGTTPSGTYTLRAQATDLFGRYTHLVVLGTFQVVTASPSPTPTPTPAPTPVGATVGITNITSTSVVASWNLPSEAQISRVDMAYYNYSNSRWTDLSSSTLKSGSRTISGLTPDTGYAFRTNTYYTSGVSKLGDIQFRTIAAPVVVTDSQLPVIQTGSLSLSKYSAKPGDSIVATYRITDDVGCCDYNQAWMYLPTGGNIQVGGVKISGTDKDSTFTATFTVPANASSGSYQIKAQATDKAGRYTHLQLIGTVVVDATKTDVELPVIDPSSVSISQTIATAGAYITGKFRVTDDVGCCNFNRIDLRTSRGAIVTMVTPTKLSGTATDAIYTGTVRIPVAASPDTFSIYAQATDTFGRYTHLVLLGNVTVPLPIVYTAPTLTIVKVGSKTAYATWSVPSSTETTATKLVLTERVSGASTDLNTLNLKSGSIDFSVKPNTNYALKVTTTYKDGSTKSDEEFFTSLVLVKPPMPNLRATSLTTSETQISWSYSYATVDKFVLRIREATGMFTSLELAASERSHKFTGLKENQMYVVEMDVIDTNGEQAVGTVVFTTPSKKKLAPPAPVITSYVADKLTASIAWAQDQNPDAETVIGWDVQIRSSESTVWKSVSNFDNLPGAQLQANISDLIPGRTYFARVISRSSTGMTSTSATKVVLIKYGLGTPGALTSSNLTWNGAFLQWAQPSDSLNEAPVGFRVEFSPEGADDFSITRKITGQGGKNSYTVTDLKSGITYRWRVVAIGLDGTETTSAIRSFKTVSAMRAPTSLNVSSVGDSWARIAWSQISNKANKSVSTFEIRVSQDQGSTWETLESNLTSNVRVVTVDDLTPETEYDVRIVALSGDGDEAFATITVTTKQNLDAITEATVSLVTARSAVIKWELPEDIIDVEAIDTVAIEIKRNGKWVSWAKNIDPAKTQATLTKLAPKTNYEYRVVSVGDDGYKEYSAPKKFKTK